MSDGLLFEYLTRPFRRWIYLREISALGREYRARTGRNPGRKSPNSDAGSFHSQLVRLFTIGNGAETGELKRLGASSITNCLSNRYYLPADLLSDLLDALEGWTFFGGEPDGEAPITDLGQAARRLKLEIVRKAFLVPLKVGSIESVMGAYAETVGRSLPYRALGRFERQVARIFAFLDESEIAWMEGELRDLLTRWKDDETLRRHFPQPDLAAERLADAYDGRRLPEDLPPSLRVRRGGQPVRLSTLELSCRQDLLKAAFREVRGEPAPRPEARGRATAPSPKGATRAVKSRQSVSPGAPPPAARSRRAPDAEPPAEEAPRLSIALSCPKCGGPSDVDDTVVSLECSYCNSLLVLSAPDRQEVYREEADPEGPGDVVEAFVRARVAVRRAEVEESCRSEDDEMTVPQFVIDARVNSYEKKLRKTSRLGEVHRIHVPYWHIFGNIVQGALGYWRGGSKALRIRALEVEHTVAAYDTRRHNFRDRGLRLGKSRLLPLTAEDVRSLSAFVAWRPIPEETYREVQKWCGRTLEAELDPVSKHGEFLFGRRLLVYRLAWLARIEGEEPQWLLIDGRNGNIGGYLDTSEVRAILARLLADPVGSEEESYKTVHVVAPRCPNCGSEQHLDPHFSFAVCTNCRGGLSPHPRALETHAYHHVSAEGVGGDVDYLPFWRFRFRLGLVDGSTTTTLDEYFASATPSPAGGTPTGDALWIPAFRFLGTLEGDEAWKALVQWLHAHPPAVIEGKIPIGDRARFLGVSRPRADARSLGRFVLLGLHPPRAVTRMNSAQLRRGVLDARLELGESDLVMVPVGRDGDRCVLPETGASFPTLLLEGGARLEALRQTVHGLRSS